VLRELGRSSPRSSPRSAASRHSSQFSNMSGGGGGGGGGGGVAASTGAGAHGGGGSGGGSGTGTASEAEDYQGDDTSQFDGENNSRRGGGGRRQKSKSTSTSKDRSDHSQSQGHGHGQGKDDVASLSSLQQKVGTGIGTIPETDESSVLSGGEGSFNSKESSLHGGGRILTLDQRQRQENRKRRKQKAEAMKMKRQMKNLGIDDGGLKGGVGGGGGMHHSYAHKLMTLLEGSETDSRSSGIVSRYGQLQESNVDQVCTVYVQYTSASHLVLRRGKDKYFFNPLFQFYVRLLRPPMRIFPSS
jgi:hypothetical protein